MSSKTHQWQLYNSISIYNSHAWNTGVPLSKSSNLPSKPNVSKWTRRILHVFKLFVLVRATFSVYLNKYYKCECESVCMSLTLIKFVTQIDVTLETVLGYFFLHPLLRGRKKIEGRVQPQRETSIEINCKARTTTVPNNRESNAK